MSKDLQTVDVVVLGTGIAESIVAAALAKAGWKVAHIDDNAFYGANEASLDLRELSRWLQERREASRDAARYGCICSNVSQCSEEIAQSRDYSISLTPTVIPATGPFISSLISSGVARYGSFKLLDSVLIYSNANDTLKPIPGNKEDIFKSQDLSLVDKRKLMRFLVFASGEFENSTQLEGKQEMPFAQFLRETFLLDDRLSVQLSCALAFSFSKMDHTMPSLTRIRQYLKSTGRYGNSPFLLGHYGGLGELAQGFCRICAVAGGTYVLSRRVLSIQTKVVPTAEAQSSQFEVHIDEIGDPILAKLLIASPDYLPLLPPEWTQSEQTASPSDKKTTFAMGVVVAREGILQHTSDDSTPEVENNYANASVLFFLPGELPEGGAEEAVCVMTNGEGTNSCPEGQTILYFSTLFNDRENINDNNQESIVRNLLQPYVDATLRLLSRKKKLETSFAAFYTRSTTPVPQQYSSSLRNHHVLLSQPLIPNFATASDEAAVEAERIFWEAVGLLREPEGVTPTVMWPALLEDDDD